MRSRSACGRAARLVAAAALAIWIAAAGWIVARAEQISGGLPLVERDPPSL